ncbi:leucyl aminopeptidase [Shimia aestuarii]|uniref:leucyl aminopeptidase n=1 Tax=Shimia aestuarii TaxID=254406 RepID=UPI001FB2601C|nr:leucyl aminopeptidase [Shimia aestuarii]
MSKPVPITFIEVDTSTIADAQGRVAIIVDPEGRMDVAARRINRLTKGALARLIEAKGAAAKVADAHVISFPVGMSAEALDVVFLSRRASALEARKAGVSLGRVRGTSDVLLCAGGHRKASEIALGVALRDYAFEDHKSDAGRTGGAVQVMVSKPAEVAAAAEPALAVAEGVFFTRDLVNEPANVLTTTEFAKRLKDMETLGLEVEVLEEDALQALGMGALLSVGEGSVSPSKVVVMTWNGGAKDSQPLALVGKGVVFDTGGISLKPAAGMEDMTMDMGGAGVVSGVMRAIALRKAKANVVGLVGLVENMPSGSATRPGDVVTSMKGDTIEVINTDAEGRLVLCDVLHYAQERFNPAGIVDLATLTGAVIIGLGHENAGVFSNDTKFCNAFLNAAEGEGEGAWRLPLGKGYADQLKSRIADLKNVGGRPAGSITAAEFLHRFIKDDMPWIHLDIAGVASVKSDTAYAPKGATGWGVLALNRLIADRYETE